MQDRGLPEAPARRPTAALPRGVAETLPGPRQALGLPRASLGPCSSLRAMLGPFGWPGRGSNRPQLQGEAAACPEGPLASGQSRPQSHSLGRAVGRLCQQWLPSGLCRCPSKLLRLSCAPPASRRAIRGGKTRPLCPAPAPLLARQACRSATPPPRQGPASQKLSSRHPTPAGPPAEGGGAACLAPLAVLPGASWFSSPSLKGSLLLRAAPCAK